MFTLIFGKVAKIPTEGIPPFIFYGYIHSKGYITFRIKYWEIKTIGLIPNEKFIKIIQGTSVWGFVALGDGLHKGVPYQRGDTFKPASWSAPAKWARGNVLNGDSHWYDWTGPNYL